jgi:hypothetical protein
MKLKDGRHSTGLAAVEIAPGDATAGRRAGRGRGGQGVLPSPHLLHLLLRLRLRLLPQSDLLPPTREGVEEEEESMLRVAGGAGAGAGAAIVSDFFVFQMNNN